MLTRPRLIRFAWALPLILWAVDVHAESPGPQIPQDKLDNGVFALDAEFVHTVGELQLHITNWGLIGSRIGTATPYSEAPSAMWPAGSGVDHLWSAGLWVGALKNNVPLVSTGQPTNEFLPNPADPLDTIYETSQGDAGGARYPDPGEDDDGDGRVNEDPLNGFDDDQDGTTDEDFAAIGNQHFRSVMRDNTPLAIEYFPEHEPLDLRVVQQSFQWAADNVDDFVGFTYEVKNIGSSTLEDVYLGFFADCDIGPRGRGGVSQDDLPGFFSGSVKASDNTFVNISVGYMYDADTDEGQSPGFFGIMFLGHLLEKSGRTAPRRASITSFHSFAGKQSFDRGGDPTTDSERYELLSDWKIERTPSLYEVDKANDYRILVSTGPFAELKPGDRLEFQAVMVAGDGLDGLLQNAADAALTYYGAYFDRDLDPSTGVRGRETRICQDDFHNPLGIFKTFVNPCDLIGGGLALPIKKDDLDRHGCIYVNSDCFEEFWRRRANDCASERDPRRLAGCTGVLGKEYNVNWLAGNLPPTAPDLRLWQTDNRVHVFWNNMSQIIPDVFLQAIDFESYRVWRADRWNRPFGSSIDGGPASDLWSLIAEFDVVSFFEVVREPEGERYVQELPLGANTGLDVIRHVPASHREGTSAFDNAAPVRSLVRRIIEDPKFDFLKPTTPPSKVMRYLDSEGRVSPVGAKYPEIRDFRGSYALVDTCFWMEMGVEFFEFVDEGVLNGVPYFYAVTATDFAADPATLTPLGHGLSGDPQSNFEFAVPHFDAQTAEERDRNGHNIFVVPNPVTSESLQHTQFKRNAGDPTGVRIMFANLPASRNTIKIYTLSGDHVETIEHDGTVNTPNGFDNCSGSAFWDLVSRNGQEVVSGIYLYSVESADAAFDRVVGRFVVIR